MSIRIIDKDFNLIGDVDDFISMRWIRNWEHSDKFTITADIRTKNINHLISDLGYNIIIFKDRQGFVDDYKIEEADISTVTITGRSLSALAETRITMPPKGKAYHTMNTNAEDIMKELVRANMVNPSDPNRKIPNVRIAPSKKRGPKLLVQTRYKNLESELARISDMSGLGWLIYLDYDTKEFVFDIVEGTDYSGADPKQNPIIFGTDFDNLIKQTKTYKKSEHKNMAVVGGQGEGEERQLVSIGNEEKGIERREVFIDARDVDMEQGDEALLSRGKERLSEMEVIDSFESMIDPYKNFLYQRDWDIGDIVLIRPNLVDKQERKRIISVEEAYEGFGLEDLVITSGRPLMTLSEKLSVIDSKINSEVIGGGGGGSGSGVVDYNQLINKPKIPKNISELTNDVGFLKDIDHIEVLDTRYENEKPSYYHRDNGRKAIFEFKNYTTIERPPVRAHSNYVYILTISGWKDPTGGYPIQLAFGTEGMAYRFGVDDDNWSSWKKIANIDEVSSGGGTSNNQIVVSHTLIRQSTDNYESFKLPHVPGHKIKEIRPIYMIRDTGTELSPGSSYYSYYSASEGKIVGSNFLFDKVDIYSNYVEIRLYKVKQANIMIIYEKE